MGKHDDTIESFIEREGNKFRPKVEQTENEEIPPRQSRSIDPADENSDKQDPVAPDAVESNATLTVGDIVESSTSIAKGLGIGTLLALLALGGFFGATGILFSLVNVFVLDTNQSDHQRNSTSQTDQRETPPAPILTDESYYHVTAKTLNLLNKPDINGYVIMKLSKFDNVTIYSNWYEWVEVETECCEGWVRGKYLAPGKGR